MNTRILRRFAAATLLLMGLALGPARLGAAGPPKVKPPFSYDWLRVRNSCLVDSIHFYDEYLRHRRGGDESWIRVLEWGNEEGDFKLASGHAVTVFVAQHRLWAYDINYGIFPLSVPLERRADIHDVSPEIFAHYPQFEPIFPRFRDDFPQTPPRKRVDYLFYHANRDVRDATKVASELSRYRPVRVFEFEYVEAGQVQKSAGAAFVFGAHLCLYFPRYGTHVAKAPTLLTGTGDDLVYLTRVVRHLFPQVANVRWQPGGYLLFPPRDGK